MDKINLWAKAVPLLSNSEGAPNLSPPQLAFHLSSHWDPCPSPSTYSGRLATSCPHHIHPSSTLPALV